MATKRAAKKPKKPESGTVSFPAKLTLSQFATLSGAHPNTVTAWRAEGLPAERSGRACWIDLQSGVRWLLARKDAKLAQTKEDLSTEGARHAKLAAEAKLKQLDLAERKSELVSAEDVAAEWGGMMAAVREAVMAVPGICVQDGLIERDQEQALEDRCRDALTAAGRRGMDEADGSDEDGDDAAQE